MIAKIQPAMPAGHQCHLIIALNRFCVAAYTMPTQKKNSTMRERVGCSLAPVITNPQIWSNGSHLHLLPSCKNCLELAVGL